MQVTPRSVVPAQAKGATAESLPQKGETSSLPLDPGDKGCRSLLGGLPSPYVESDDDAAFDWLVNEKLSVLDFVDRPDSAVEPVKPIPIEVTPFKLVEDLKGLKQLAIKLRNVDEFAYRSFQGLTCLMQISTRTEDFIIDTLRLRVQIGPHLREVLHGADRDIVWLQRDFGIYVCNMFDTGQPMTEVWLKALGLEGIENGKAQPRIPVESFLWSRGKQRETGKTYEVLRLQLPVINFPSDIPPFSMGLIAQATVASSSYIDRLSLDDDVPWRKAIWLRFRVLISMLSSCSCFNLVMHRFHLIMSRGFRNNCALCQGQGGARSCVHWLWLKLVIPWLGELWWSRFDEIVSVADPLSFAWLGDFSNKEGFRSQIRNLWWRKGKDDAPEEPLHSAVMLEKASYCFLLSTPTMLRKYGSSCSFWTSTGNVIRKRGKTYEVLRLQLPVINFPSEEVRVRVLYKDRWELVSYYIRMRTEPKLWLDPWLNGLCSFEPLHIVKANEEKSLAMEKSLAPIQSQDVGCSDAKAAQDMKEIPHFSPRVIGKGRTVDC
ncbi:UNVERIFIED_CONTAM: protein RRP6-like 2 [Sesamum calycinum]|uniref:Protein RRP6-like 2 n=1 Tax=Sesamum calycinum TaxID=2727403 RepID=A0AAW2NV96_9LAMI